MIDYNKIEESIKNYKIKRKDLELQNVAAGWFTISRIFFFFAVVFNERGWFDLLVGISGALLEFFGINEIFLLRVIERFLGGNVLLSVIFFRQCWYSNFVSGKKGRFEILFFSDVFCNFGFCIE